MTRDDILRLALEAAQEPAGVFVYRGGYDAMTYFEKQAFDRLETFARLVAAHEREQCALILQRNAQACSQGSILESFLAAGAVAIRARGDDAGK